MRTSQKKVITVTLDEQSHKFAHDKRQAVKGTLQIKQNGRAEVDLKVENLKSGTYKLFFIGRKNGNSVYKMIGDLVPGKNGTAEFSGTLDPSDVDGEGTGLSYFYIFMLAAAGMPLRPVLKGDLVNSEAASRMRKEKKVYNSYYSEYIRQMTAQLIGGEQRFADISPFDDEWLSDNWKRVTDASKLPVASMGAQAQVAQYGHFVFAYNEELLFLAVPGRHTEDEWPDRGASGFLMWQSIKGSKEYGYWCMVVDREAGIITEIS